MMGFYCVDAILGILSYPLVPVPPPPPPLTEVCVGWSNAKSGWETVDRYVIMIANGLALTGECYLVSY